MTAPIKAHIPISAQLATPERDATPPNVTWFSREEVRNFCIEQRIVDPQYRLIQEVPDVPGAIEAPLAEPPLFASIRRCMTLPFRLLLRGSKAAQWIQPEKYFLRLIGCPDSTLYFVRHDPKDEDWLFELQIQPLHGQLSHLCRDLSPLFTKGPTIPGKNVLVHHNASFILGSFESIDVVIGKLETRHLFLRDAFAIEINEGGNHRIMPEHFWQAVVDHTLGIVRLEKRHEQDFYAFLAAVEQVTKGALLIEEETSLANILSQFPDLTPEWIVYAVQKRLEQHQIDPLAFLYNVCAHLDERDERVWQLGFEAVRLLSVNCSYSNSLIHFLKGHPLPYAALKGVIDAPYFLPADRARTVIDPHLSRFLEKEQLLRKLKSHHPTAVNPYPQEWIRALRRLHHEKALTDEDVALIHSYPGIRLERTQTEEIAAFVTGDLSVPEKRKLQEKLGFESTTAWLPDDLMRKVLKNPATVSEPLVLFDYCSWNVKRELLQTKAWIELMTARFSPDALWDFFSFMKPMQLLALLLIPAYQEHLKDHLETVIERLENSPSLHHNFFVLLFAWMLRFPDKGAERLSAPAFQTYSSHKGFKEPFEAALPDLIRSPMAPFPLLDPIHTLGIRLDRQVLQDLLNSCFEHPSLCPMHVTLLFPFYKTDISLLDTLELSPPRSAFARLASAVFLMEIPGREIEALKLVDPLLDHPELLHVATFHDFISRLVSQVPHIVFKEPSDWIMALKLIGWGMNQGDDQTQQLIITQLIASPAPQVRAQGLFWNLQHLESSQETADFKAIYAHFRSLGTLPEYEQPDLRLSLINSPLLQHEWNDEKFPLMLFHCFFKDFAPADNHASNQLVLFYLRLHGARLLQDPEIAGHFFKLIKSRIVRMIVSGDQLEGIQLFYIALSALLLRGDNYPSVKMDPAALFLSLRRDDAQDEALASLSQDIFLQLKHQSPAFCLIIFSTYLQSVLEEHPSQAHRELYFLLMDWIFYHDGQLPEGSSVPEVTRLIDLAEAAGMYSPQELALHKLMSLQEPAEGVLNSLALIEIISALKCNHHMDARRKMLKILHLIQHLLKNEEYAPRAIAATHLYSQINMYYSAALSSSFAPFPDILQKIKECIQILIRNRVQVPKEAIQSLKMLESLSQME